MSQDFLDRSGVTQELKICEECDDSFSGRGDICMECRYEVNNQ